MEFNLPPEDIALFSRPPEDFKLAIEATTNCDGVPCNAPCPPHDPTEPHWHLRMTLTGTKGARLSYIRGI